MLEPRNTEYNELEGQEREVSLKEFQARTGWLRGTQANRLSDEEAGIIAARLVRRVQEKEKLRDDKAKKLEAAITDIYKRRFTGDPAKDRLSEQTTRAEILKAGRELLDGKGRAALEAALAQGSRPQPKEK